MLEARLLVGALATVAFIPFAFGAKPDQASDLSKARIMFLGDSITQAGDYVSFIEYVLGSAYPKSHFDIVSIGLASETVSGLSESVHPFPRPCVHDRLWAALDVVKPKTVFACYGINDGIYHPLGSERFKAFKDGITKLLAINKAAGVKTVLITPPPFDPIAAGGSLRPASAADFSYMNVFEGYDEVVTEYGRWELTLANPDVQIVDVHTPLLAYVSERRKSDPKFTLSGDGVHINEFGHWIMAKAILSSLGVSQASLPYSGTFNAGGPEDPQFTLVIKDPLFKLIDKRRKLRSSAWLPFVGYVRDTAFKTWTIVEAEKESHRLQVEIDQLRKVLDH